MRIYICSILLASFILQGCSVLGIFSKGDVDNAYKKGKEETEKTVSDKIKDATSKAVQETFSNLNVTTKKLALHKEKYFLVDEDNRHSVEFLLGSLFYINCDTTVTRYINILDTIKSVKNILPLNQSIFSEIIDRGLKVDLKFLADIAANLDDNSKMQVKHDKILSASLELDKKIDLTLRKAKKEYYLKRDTNNVEDFLFVTNVIVERIRLKRFTKLTAGTNISYIGMKIGGDLYNSDDVEIERHLVYLKGIQLSQVTTTDEKDPAKFNDGQKILALLKNVYPDSLQSRLLDNSSDSTFLERTMFKLSEENQNKFMDLIDERDVKIEKQTLNTVINTKDEMKELRPKVY
jgi:hypothetical protein